MHESGMNDEFCSLYLAPQASRSARRLRAVGTFGRDGTGATRGSPSTAALDGSRAAVSSGED